MGLRHVSLWYSSVFKLQKWQFHLVQSKTYQVTPLHFCRKTLENISLQMVYINSKQESNYFFCLRAIIRHTVMIKDICCHWSREGSPTKLSTCFMLLEDVRHRQGRCAKQLSRSPCQLMCVMLMVPGDYLLSSVSYYPIEWILEIWAPKT